MKLIWSIIIILLLTKSNVSAQNDSSAYEAQRNKINKLLNERSSRFGQYDSSLGKRSGIFGLKTKRDLQFSNDILRQIVLTDNDIFSELKVLMDYKDFEKKQVEARAETVEGRIDRYQTTITRLQQENEKLRVDSEKSVVHADKLFNYLLISVIVLLLSLFFICMKILRKSDKSGLKSA